MKARSTWLTISCTLSALLLILIFSGRLGLAQRKQKPPKDQKAEPLVRLPDDQQIDASISEMLAAWQLGDTEMLHKHYADDVMVVSGAWEPPLLGWSNYVRAYQAQRQRMQSGRLDRSNTFIVVKGSIAWATYQWDFGAVVDGRATAARGQTTLIFEKRGDRWLIVHNHTSMVPEMKPAAPAQQPAAPKPNPPGN